MPNSSLDCCTQSLGLDYACCKGIHSTNINVILTMSISSFNCRKSRLFHCNREREWSPSRHTTLPPSLSQASALACTVATLALTRVGKIMGEDNLSRRCMCGCWNGAENNYHILLRTSWKVEENSQQTRAKLQHHYPVLNRGEPCLNWSTCAQAKECILYHF